MASISVPNTAKGNTVTVTTMHMHLQASTDGEEQAKHQLGLSELYPCTMA
jgi:hypothetical protein